MQGFGTDRTLSGQEWRSLILAGCGVLVVGVGMGVLIGRLTAAPPEPPPASASILPDTVGSPTIDVAGDVTNSTAPPPPSPPAVAPAVPPPVPPAAIPPVQPSPVASTPEVPAPALRQPARPVETKRAEAKPKVAARPVPKPVSKPAAAEIPAPAGGARWAVQLGAFQSSDHANLLVYTLARHGQPASVHLANGWFYVQTPPFHSAAAAKSAAQALAAREHLATYLIKLPEQAG